MDPQQIEESRVWA